MALTSGYADRVAETTATSGTGALSLGGAWSVDYQTFSNVFANGTQCYYTIMGGSDWEVGEGTYLSAGDQLTRDHVYASSNAGALVNLANITHIVFCDLPAQSVADKGFTMMSSMHAVLQ